VAAAAAAEAGRQVRTHVARCLGDFGGGSDAVVARPAARPDIDDHHLALRSSRTGWRHPAIPGGTVAAERAEQSRKVTPHRIQIDPDRSIRALPGLSPGVGRMRFGDGKPARLFHPERFQEDRRADAFGELDQRCAIFYRMS